MLKFRLKQKLLPWLFGNNLPKLLLLLVGFISFSAHSQVGIDSTQTPSPVSPTEAPTATPTETPIATPATAPTLPPQVGDRTVSGVVKDKNGEAVIGAVVSIKGASIGTVTDENGAFTLKVPEAQGNGTLVISYVGFKTTELPLATTTSFDLVLQDESTEMNEVVVVGYGTQEKEDVTGAISSVKGVDLAKVVVTDATQALQGRAPGVSVTQNTGSPGSPLTVQIRGVGTIGNSSPLYVVNGVPVGDIGYLNTNDIESIDVLKDASAAAIYGSRAANGVILITTKKGSTKKTTFDFNFLTGMSKEWKRMKLLDAKEWATLKNEALVGSGQPAAYNTDTIGMGTNWQDQIFKKALMQSYQLSASGATEKSNYYISGSYLNQGGIVKNSGYERYNFNVNNVSNLTKRFTLGTFSNIAFSDRLIANDAGDYTSVIASALTMNPMGPVYANRGTDSTYAPGLGDSYNPVAQINNRTNRQKGINYLGSFYGEYKILKYIKLKTSLGYSYNNTTINDFQARYFVKTGQANETSDLIRQFDMSRTAIWENSANFEKTFAEKHKVTVLALFGVQDTRTEYTKTVKSKTASNDPSNQFFDSASDPTVQAFGNASENSLVSYLGRVNYEYKNKYLFTGNIRRDESSRFPKDHRAGYFPSVAAGWKISEEGFFEPFKGTISFLKVRAGWGKLGNQNLVGVNANYPYTTNVYGNQNYSFNGTVVPGSSPNSVGNPNIKWESVTTSNIAIDFGFFRNRITFTVDYFTKTTNDMLIQRKIPAIVGVEVPPYVNGGKMSNKGLELSAEYRENSHAIKYRVGANITFIKNKVLTLGDPIADGLFRANYVNITQEGSSISQFYGLKTDGIIQTQEEAAALQKAQPGVQAGDFKYQDLNGDGVITASDRTTLGSPIPKFTYGFNADVSWKNFDMTMLLQGVYGNKIFNGTKYVLESSDMQTNNNKSEAMLDRWTGPNTSSTLPRVSQVDNNSAVSDYYVESGSYLRLKILQIGYTLPIALTQKIKMERLRIFIGAQNLFTITKYSGFDPEIGTSNYATVSGSGVSNPQASPLDIGVDRGGTYPQARTFQFGINASF